MAFFVRRLMTWATGRSFDFASLSSLYNNPTSYNNFSPKLKNNFEKKLESDAQGNVTLKNFIKIDGDVGILGPDGEHWTDAPEERALDGVLVQSTRSSYSTSGNILYFSSPLQAGDLVVACINNWAWSLGPSVNVTLAAQATHQWNASYASKAIIVYYIASGGETSLNAASHSIYCSSTSAVYRFGSPVQSVLVREPYALNTSIAGNRTMNGSSYGAPQIIVATKAKYSGTVTLTNSSGYDYGQVDSTTTAEGLALYKVNNTAASSLVSWSASATTGCVAACILEPTF